MKKCKKQNKKKKKTIVNFFQSHYLCTYVAIFREIDVPAVFINWFHAKKTEFATISQCRKTRNFLSWNQFCSNFLSKDVGFTKFLSKHEWEQTSEISTAFIFEEKQEFPKIPHTSIHKNEFTNKKDIRQGLMELVMKEGMWNYFNALNVTIWFHEIFMVQHSIRMHSYDRY